VQLWWAGAGEGKINGWRRGRVKTPIAAMPQPKNKLGALWPDAASRPRWKNRFDAGPLRRKTNGMLRLILLPLRKPNTARLVALLYIYGGRKTIAKGNVEITNLRRSSDRRRQASAGATPAPSEAARGSPPCQGAPALIAPRRTLTSQNSDPGSAARRPS